MAWQIIAAMGLQALGKFTEAQRQQERLEAESKERKYQIEEIQRKAEANKFLVRSDEAQARASQLEKSAGRGQGGSATTFQKLNHISGRAALEISNIDLDVNYQKDAAARGISSLEAASSDIVDNALLDITASTAINSFSYLQSTPGDYDLDLLALEE